MVPVALKEQQCPTAELRAPNTAWQAAIAHVETDIPRDACIISFGGLDRTYVP